MLRGGWYIAVALGLALASIPAASRAQPLESPRVPVHRPTAESQDQRKADENEKHTERLPFPVRVIESGDDAKRARDREQKSDEHDAADLQAQRDAARAAERAAKAGEGQESAAWWAIYIAAAGTLGLVASLLLSGFALLENRKTTKLTQDQVRLMQAELRAWLAIDSVEADYRAIRSKDEIVIPISVKLSNTGKSTALNTRVAFTPFLEIGAHEGLGKKIDEMFAHRDWTFEPSTKNIAAGKHESIGGVIRSRRLQNDDERWSYQIYVLVVVTYETIGHEGTAETGRTFHTLNLRIDEADAEPNQTPRFWPTDSVKQWMT